MKKIFVALSMVAFLAACDDSSSASAGPNDEPGVESSSSVEPSSSSSEKVKSSSSKEEKESKASLSSEKRESSSSAKSSSSAESSSSLTSVSSSSSAPNDEPSSSSVIPGSDSESSSSKESSSSSVDKVEPSSGENSSSSAMVTITSSDGSVYNSSNNTLMDLRNGQTYRTVKIGNQIWMAENLNLAYVKARYDSDGVVYDSISWCNNNRPTNCVRYGRLYTWAAAMDSVGVWSESGKGCGNAFICSPVPPVRGICPNGWHLPSDDEWRILVTTVGGDSIAGKVLKSTSEWPIYNGQRTDGTDAYSFTALPAGGMNSDGFYGSLSGLTTFWSSTEKVYFFAGFARMSRSNYLDFDDSINKDGAYSVRCLKD